MTINDKHKKLLCESIMSSGSLNFPQLCKDLKLSWVRDVLPALREDSDFRLDFQEALEYVKYALVEEVAFLARTGRSRRQIDTASVNATLKYLDINNILNTKPIKATIKDEEESEETLSEEEIQARLAKINLPNVED